MTRRRVSIGAVQSIAKSVVQMHTRHGDCLEGTGSERCTRRPSGTVGSPTEVLPHSGPQAGSEETLAVASEPDDSSTTSDALHPRGEIWPSSVSARVSAGVGLRQYSLRSSNSNVDYGSTPFPELGLVLSTTPFHNGGWLVEGFGIEGGFLRSLLVSVIGENTGRATQEISTPMQRWYIDAQYRLCVIPGSISCPRVGIRVGWGDTQFMVQEATGNLTSVQHDGLRLGFEIVEPVFGPHAHVDVSATFVPWSRTRIPEPLVKSGSVVDSAWGLALRAGIAGDVSASLGTFTWGLWVDGLQYSDTFASGSTASSAAGNSTAGSESPAQSGRAVERQISFHAAIGYAL